MTSTRINHALFLLPLIALALATGCSKSSDGGTATLKLSNTLKTGMYLTEGMDGTLSDLDPTRAGLSDPAMYATSSDPTIFKMMLIAAYMTEDINATTGNNVGQTSMFYLNPDCGDDIMHCDISAGTAEDGAPYSKVVTSFFDLADTTTNVNKALNAQGRSITAATYKYVRLEFCKVNSASANNIQWGDGTVGTISFQRNQCTVNSAVLSPAITVAKGDAVTVTVAYDLTGSIKTGTDASGDNCTGSGASKECFTLPTFTPSASK